MHNENPLKSFFRQPAIYLQLPSKGLYWQDGSISIPVTGEIPVYSMTAGDEIMLMTPDALINGEATIKLIESCMPNIKDAWQTPSVDLEAILIAIRIASVGEKITITSQCPSCSESNNYEIDLVNLLSQFDVDIWKTPIEIAGLTFTFKPMRFNKVNDYQNRLFQTKKKMTQIQQMQDVDQQEKLTNEVISEFNSLDLEFLIETIRDITAGNQVVSDREYISEFILNCDKKVYAQIKQHVEKLKNSIKCNDLIIDCDDCHHVYSSELSLDYASFFG